MKTMIEMNLIQISHFQNDISEKNEEQWIAHSYPILDKTQK